MQHMVQKYGGQVLLADSVGQLRWLNRQAFAGAGKRVLRGLDILTIKWATGDLPEECRFLLNTQLMFLKKENDPTTKQFDDDEWIRSLTEAPEVTTDIPEDSVTPRKFGPLRWRSPCGNTSRGDFWHSVREKLQPSRHRCGRSECALQVALRPCPSSISSSSMNG